MLLVLGYIVEIGIFLCYLEAPDPIGWFTWAVCSYRVCTVKTFGTEGCWCDSDTSISRMFIAYWELGVERVHFCFPFSATNHQRP